MQNIVLHSRSWKAIPGCLHGIRQPTLLGHFVAGELDAAIMVQADERLLQSFDELNLAVPDAPGAIGLLHRVARLAEAAQNYFGNPVSGDCSFSRRATAPGQVQQVFDAALPYHHADSARAAIAWAVFVINHLVLSEHAGALDEAKRSLDDLGKRLKPAGLTGINSVHFVRAGYQLGIPVERYTDEVYRYGTGPFVRVLHSTASDRTSRVGVSLARSKYHTAAVLRYAGLPASAPQRVRSVEEALLAAERLGYPAVVKPNDKDNGVGVFACLRSPEEVRDAYRQTTAASQQVLIERHFSGNDYRLTVHEERVIKVEQRIACGIVGDGASTVAELVEAKQASAHLRRILRETGKIPLSLDHEALGLLQGERLDETSVPERGRVIALRRKNNISSGGEQVGVRVSEVHPDNAALAVRAARLLFLDIAGVDLIIPDIGISWQRSGAVICEVNAMPQVGVRTSPDIYRDMLRRLLGDQARIPANLLVHEETGDSTYRHARGLAARLGCNAISSLDGTWIDGKCVGRSPSAFTGASSLLRDPDCRAALCLMPLGGVLAKGLPLDWFDRIFLPERLLTNEALLRALQPHAGAILRAPSHA